MTGQSVKHSLIEACTNIAVGYLVSVLANYCILPLVGFHINMEQSMFVGLLFTLVSLVRSFVLRRLFNRLMVKLSNQQAEG